MSRISVFLLLPALAPLTLAPQSVAQAQDASQITSPSSLRSSVSSPEPEITLDELVRRASEKSLQNTIAREGVEAAQQRVQASRAAPSPYLLLVPGLGSREARDEEAVLAQPLDVFGLRRAHVAVAQAELRRAQMQLTLAERALLVQVKSAGVELFAAQENELLNLAQAEVAEAFANATRRRAELGEAPAVQAERAELELWRAQNEAEAARAERLAKRAALNVLIGQEPQTPLRVAPPDAVLLEPLRVSLPLHNPLTPQLQSLQQPATGAQPPTTVPNAAPNTELNTPSPNGAISLDLETWRPRLLELTQARPDIASAQALVEVRRAQVLELNAQRRPTVELQLRRTAVLSSNGGWGVRAVLTIPLFGNKALRGEQRALQAEARAGEAQAALLRAQATAQLETALVRWQERRARVERYRTALVPRTLDLLRKTQLGYTAGASTYLEVLEAQRTLRQVQSEYLQSLIESRTQQVALENAIGTSLPTALLPGGEVTPLNSTTPRKEAP